MTTMTNRIFTKKTILIGTFLGGPLIAGIMISHNYKVFGNKDAASRSMIIGILSTVLIFMFAFLTPEDIIDKIPNIVIPCVYTAIVAWLINERQAEDMEQFIEEGGETKSAWTAVGYTFVVLTFYIGIFAVLLLVFDDENSLLDESSEYTERIHLGRNTDLYYSPDISEDIIERLAEILRSPDFDIEDADLMFGETDDCYELIFIIPDELSLYDPDFVKEFYGYEEYLNENMGLRKRIEIKFTDPYLEHRYELKELDDFSTHSGLISA